MTSSGKRPGPRNFPPELRERAVKMVFEVRRQTGERQGSVSRVAGELGIGAETLRNWVRRTEIDGGERPGTSSDDAQRIAELERENWELRLLRPPDPVPPGGGAIGMPALRRRRGARAPPPTTSPGSSANAAADGWLGR